MQRGWSLALLVLSALAGCSSMAAPGVEVASMSLGESSDEARVVLVTLRLSNPNDEALELRDVKYDFRVEAAGVPPSHGRREALITIPARGQGDLVVPAVVRMPASAPSIDSGTISGSLTYLAPGALAEQLFDLGVRKPKVGFGGSQAIVQR